MLHPEGHPDNQFVTFNSIKDKPVHCVSVRCDKILQSFEADRWTFGTVMKIVSMEST